jgi:hypothetical protein
LYLDTTSLLESGLSVNLEQAEGLFWSDDQNVYGIGDPAPTGWYRDLSNGLRRYWNQSTQTFEGSSFNQDYVNRVYRNFGSGGTFNSPEDPGYNTATGAVLDPGSGNVTQTICQQDQDYHLTYVAGKLYLLVPDPDQISQTQNIKNYQTNAGLYQIPPADGTCLYVTVNWVVPMIDLNTNTIVNTPPLTPIHLQDGQFLTSPYEKVYMEDVVGSGGNGDYANILLTNGKIGTISSCPIPPP